MNDWSGVKLLFVILASSNRYVEHSSFPIFKAQIMTCQGKKAMRGNTIKHMAQGLSEFLPLRTKLLHFNILTCLQTSFLKQQLYFNIKGFKEITISQPRKIIGTHHSRRSPNPSVDNYPLFWTIHLCPGNQYSKNF